MGGATDTIKSAQLSINERMMLSYQVEQFLYHEADLLDRRRYREWFELVAEDVHYWIPIRRTVTLANIDREFTKLGDMAFFDDDYSDLKMRVEKLYTGASWSEDPPSRTRHFVANVQLTNIEDDVVSVQSAIHLFRSRLENVTDDFYGRREDKLRRHGQSFQLVQRHVYLDHTIIDATNLSSLF
jgi:3-phenylpropionate/cinnamic acid dioxygenase small subunit